MQLPLMIGSLRLTMARWLIGCAGFGVAAGLAIVATTEASDSFILRPLGDTRVRTLPTVQAAPLFGGGTQPAAAPATFQPTPQPVAPAFQPSTTVPPVVSAPPFVTAPPTTVTPFTVPPRVVAPAAAPTYTVPASTYATPPVGYGLPAGSYFIPNTAVPGGCAGPSPFRPITSTYRQPPRGL